MKPRIVVLLLPLLSVPVWAAGWVKYVAPDKSLSMHCPEGWTPTADGNGITFSDAATHEDLQFSVVASEAGKAPRQVAEETLAALRDGGMPDLEVREWRDSPDPASFASVQTAYAQGGQRFISDLWVLKAAGAAILLGYTSPEEAYAAGRATALLQGLAQSLAEGDASQPPDVTIPEPTGGQSAQAAAQPQVVARAFLFVVEFAIGTPLAATQEQVIVDQLEGLLAALSPADRAQYDGYLRSMATILTLKEDQVEPVRNTLEETVRQQLETGGDDPGIRAIREQLEKSRQVVADGNPPLTEVEATAFGEMIAYGQLLYTSPEAVPQDVDPEAVTRWHDHLVEVWGDLSQANRDQLKGLPGMWMVDRTTLTVGTSEEQSGLRKKLKEMAPAPQPEPTPAANAGQPAAGAAAPAGGPAPWHSDLGRQLTRNYLNNQAFMQRSQQWYQTSIYGRAFGGW